MTGNRCGKDVSVADNLQQSDVCIGVVRRRLLCYT
mgnify:CR=1 FL=1